MYSYYLLTSLKVPCPWKPYVTRLQIAQFILAFGQGGLVVYKGTSPTPLALIQQFVALNMMVLFGNFYISEYVFNRRAVAKKLESSKKIQ